jgi:benzoate/toluate 1,2-dioxygenase beta subunit
MDKQVSADSSRSSFYVTDGFYTQLVSDFTDWQSDERAVADYGERDRFRMLIEREARLLDHLDYDAWLAMFTPECVYWAPSTPNAGDPRREIAVIFDDRRRLEDRIYRLRTGYAWSQAPQSRTARLVTNVETFATRDPHARMVRANFQINEFWDGEMRLLAGWAGYRFIEVECRWLISARQINLLECDQCLRNPSIIL